MGIAILIGGEKGGTGKSTIAVNLAIMCKMKGHDVLLLDTDKQGSSRKFINHRNEREISQTPPCLQITGKHINSELENLAKKYSFIIIDAGGKDSVELRASMASPIVKYLFSPLRPSEFDLETLSTMDELTYLSKAYNEQLKTYIIFNLCPTHAGSTVTKDSIELIDGFENLKVSRSCLSNRVAFSYAQSRHQSVIEFEREKIKELPKYQAEKYSDKASNEISQLYKEIFGEDFS